MNMQFYHSLHMSKGFDLDDISLYYKKIFCNGNGSISSENGCLKQLLSMLV